MHVKIKRVAELFALAMEDIFGELNWQNKGILINGERLSHLRFTDDITLIVRDLDELLSMIEELNEKLTKYLTNDIDQNQHTITINNRTVKKVESYIYLGQKIEITKNNIMQIYNAEYPWHGQHLGECKMS